MSGVLIFWPALQPATEVSRLVQVSFFHLMPYPFLQEPGGWPVPHKLFDPQREMWPFGTHLAVVRIDRDRTKPDTLANAFLTPHELEPETGSTPK